MKIIKENRIGNFSIAYEDLPLQQCLQLILHGKYNEHCGEIVLKEADYLMKSLNYKRCMVNLNDAEYDMSFAEIFFQADYWDEIGVSRNYKIAYVSEQLFAGDTLVFLDNVLNNRGWKVRRFADVQSALNWLDLPGAETSGFPRAQLTSYK